ncbi:MAG TPA: ABC transporter substrate-binding protein, partial [Blastocatellia bacterium]|nr:ABC transporter substrate-binding protein [Blastocatellia bacterium]
MSTFKNRLFLVIGGIGILFAILAASYFVRQANTIGVQQIGVILPLTGDASSYGQKGRRAIEMAVDDFNAHERATGKKV